MLGSDIKGKNKEEYEEICKIEFKDEQYVIQNVREESKNHHDEFMCRKASASYENDFLLKKGSVMKIGKSKLQVLDIKLHEKPMAQRKTFYD